MRFNMIHAGCATTRRLAQRLGSLTQTAVMARVPVLAAMSAPSSLAVHLARDSGRRLVALLRGDSINGYSRPDRVI